MPEEVDLQRLLVSMEANYKKFERELQKANGVAARQTRAIESNFERMNTRISGFLSSTTRLAGQLGVALGGAAIVRQIRAAVQAVSDLGDAAAAAGISAERLQVFRHHLELNGAEAEDADDAIRRFNKGLGDVAQTGGGPAAAALRALRINIHDANGELRSTDDVLLEVWDKLGRVEDASQLASIAADLFGNDAGPRLAAALRTGVDGLNQTEEAMRRVGRVISDEGVAKAQTLADGLDVLSGIIRDRFANAVINAAGGVEDFIPQMEGLGSKIGDIFDLISRNSHLIDNLVGGLVGLRIAGPIGGLIGALVPEVAKLFSATDEAAAATRRHEEATAALAADLAASQGFTVDQTRQFIAEKEAALQAADAVLQLAIAHQQAALDAGTANIWGEEWNQMELDIRHRMEEVQALRAAIGDARARLPPALPGTTNVRSEAQGQPVWVHDADLPPLYNAGVVADRSPAGETVPPPWRDPPPGTEPFDPTLGGGAGTAEAMAARLQALRDTVATEKQIEEQGFQERLAALQEFIDAGAISREDAAALEQQLTQQHADRLLEIERENAELRAQVRQQFFSAVSQFMGAMSQLIGTEGEKQLRLSKAFATAEVAINTAQGISQALKEGPGRFIKAAAIAASGAAQIAAIHRARPGNATAPSVGAGGAGGGTGPTRTLIVQGFGRGAFFTSDMVRDLMDEIVEAQRDGAKIIYEPT